MRERREGKKLEIDMTKVIKYEYISGTVCSGNEKKRYKCDAFFLPFWCSLQQNNKKKYKTRSKRKKLHQSKYNLMIKSEEVKYKTDDEEMGECMR